MRPACKRCIDGDWRICPSRKSIELVSKLKLGFDTDPNPNQGWDLRISYLRKDGACADKPRRCSE